jgi:hypothetical protein
MRSQRKTRRRRDRRAVDSSSILEHEPFRPRTRLTSERRKVRSIAPGFVQSDRHRLSAFGAIGLVFRRQRIKQKFLVGSHGAGLYMVSPPHHQLARHQMVAARSGGNHPHLSSSRGLQLVCLATPTDAQLAIEWFIRANSGMGRRATNFAAG